MDLSDIDPNLFLYSVVISLNIGECLLCRLNGLWRLYSPLVLIPVIPLAIISSVILSSGILILIEVLIAVLPVLVIIAVAAAVLTGLTVFPVLAILTRLAGFTVLRPFCTLIAGIIPVPVAVSVSVAVVLTAVVSVAVISVAISDRCRISILSHQISPLSNQVRIITYPAFYIT